jgi:hypothetical protein
MARPERNNVDYFPFICEDGQKMFYIEETYGNDGFASFVKILRELAKANHHYLDLSKPAKVMFLCAKCKVSKDVLLSIIKDLVELGKFDTMLWDENNIIWCQDFIDSIQDAYFKRKNKCITYDGLLVLLISLGVRKPSKSKPIESINPQSIVEYIKVEENKVNNNKNDLIFNELLVSESWIELTAMQSTKKFNPNQVKVYLKKYNDMINVQFEFKNNKTEYCTHFVNWLNKQEKENVNATSIKNRKEF